MQQKLRSLPCIRFYAKRTSVTQPPVLAHDLTSAVLPIRYVEVLWFPVTLTCECGGQSSEGFGGADKLSALSRIAGGCLQTGSKQFPVSVEDPSKALSWIGICCCRGCIWIIVHAISGVCGLRSLYNGVCEGTNSPAPIQQSALSASPRCRCSWYGAACKHKSRLAGFEDLPRSRQSVRSRLDEPALTRTL